MRQQGTTPTPPEQRYDDTRDPRNPPNSVVNPAVRGKALTTYLGGILVLFAIIGVALVYWSSVDRGAAAPDGDPSPIGTAGEQRPGGFDPTPDHGDTQSEIEFRGGGEPPQGPMPGLGAGAAPDARQPATDAPQAQGRIDLDNVAVERVEAGSMWVRDGNRTFEVLVPSGTNVRQGAHVDISGTLEPGDNGGQRIRATRVDVRN